MKIKFIRWMSLLAGITLLTNLTSCIKDKGYKLETDFSSLQDHVVLLNAGVGSAAISSSNVAFNSDTATVTIIVNLTSVNPPSSPVNVTIGVDAAQIDPYNTAHGTAFELLPDSAYTLANTALTVPAGQQYAETTISFYKSKIDPSSSFMLPISIVDASGKSLSTNENTRFFNIIGNPIAGNYSENWQRWQASDTTGAPFYNFTDDNIFSAESPTQVAVQSVENGALFHISFTNTGGVLSNFNVTLDPSSWTNFGATAVLQDPAFLTVDPVAGVYRFWFKYSVSGSPRTVIQTFTKE
ncbi:MAG TPA: DUF1735 domain-containing protein [Chitinophagaceae bacterium]